MVQKRSLDLGEPVILLLPALEAAAVPLLFQRNVPPRSKIEKTAEHVAVKLAIVRAIGGDQPDLSPVQRTKNSIGDNVRQRSLALLVRACHFSRLNERVALGDAEPRHLLGSNRFRSRRFPSLPRGGCRSSFFLLSWSAPGFLFHSRQKAVCDSVRDFICRTYRVDVVDREDVPAIP